MDEEQRGDQDESKQEGSEMDGPENIEYERLSEFFFDLCLSWC